MAGAWNLPDPTWSASMALTVGRCQQWADICNYMANSRPNQVIKRDNNANYTTTSTTFVDIDGTNLVVTLTISSTKALITFTATIDPAGAGSAFPDFDILIDGTRYGSAGADGISSSTASAARQPVCITIVVSGLSVGSHTFKPQWKSHAAGTSQLASGNGTAGQDYIPTFSVVEIG